ncbi:hypothetical protein [Pontixanthobacter aquaemixtae]|uniref:Uncharacterized protein n=1 Tax=Pontixanthobacter aquaemixtae TaxID=1958940 RepID=A0A844ZUD9_9SPHN|nr:hypothetical protein [Pontixanthobacter aquaemixtae]MXO91931.1 hypothetical protein [Pontixanthobacter aquaemixtae]
MSIYLALTTLAIVLLVTGINVVHGLTSGVYNLFGKLIARDRKPGFFWYSIAMSVLVFFAGTVTIIALFRFVP